MLLSMTLDNVPYMSSVIHVMSHMSCHIFMSQMSYMPCVMHVISFYIVYILDVTFKNFKMNSNGKRDYIFSTSPGNEDGQHPIETSGLTLVDVEEGSKVFYHRPSVGLVIS